MHFSIIFALALASVSGVPGQRKEGRIIKGMPAARGQFPYQGALFTNLLSFCGFFIYKNCAVTVAHCLEDVKSGLLIYGTTDIRSFRFFQTFNSSAINIHPSWNNRTLKNDMGYIKLSKKLPNSALVQSAELSCSPNTCQVDDTTVVSGWGKTSDTSSISRYLQHADLPITSNKVCDDYYDISLSDDQYCVDAPNNSSACNGDSGSPGVVSTRIACGMVSFGSAASCEIGAPTVFTKIFNYCEWIEEGCN